MTTAPTHPVAERKLGGLLTRVLTALVLFPTALVLTLVPSLAPIFALFIAAFACVGLFEYYRLVEAKGYFPEHVAGVFCGTLITLTGSYGDPTVTAGVLFFSMVMVSAIHVTHARGAIASLATSICGLVYVGWFPAHLLLLHSLGVVGRGLVLVLLVAVVLTDVAAYFVGKQFGRHKLAPVVSPKKTWEGSAGGLLFSIAGMSILYFLNRRFEWPWLPEWPLWQYAITGALLSVAAQIGDLFESALKRDAEVKDSGALFPGHGGVLDRCDGFLFAAPVLYYMALI